MDVIGFRTNVASANLKFSANLAEATTLELDAHVFSRLEEPSLGRAADADSNLAGFEFDTQLVQAIGRFAYARGLYGMFVANADHYGASTSAHFVEIQAGLKF